MQFISHNNHKAFYDFRDAQGNNLLIYQRIIQSPQMCFIKKTPAFTVRYTLQPTGLPSGENYYLPFSGEFVKWRKAAVGFVASICLSVRMEELDSYRKDFHEL